MCRFCSQVRDLLPADKSTATVACLLVQEGAEMFLSNKKSLTPLQLCSAEVATVVMGFPSKKTYAYYSVAMLTWTFDKKLIAFKFWSELWVLLIVCDTRIISKIELGS